MWEKREGVEKNAVHAGDSLDLTVYDGEKDSWQSKTVTVLAVVCDTDMYGTGDIGYSDLIGLANSFQELLPSYDKMIGSVQIQTEGELTKEEAEQITAIYEKEHFTQAMVEDCFSDRGDFESQKHTMSLIGMFLASLFGIIGLEHGQYYDFRCVFSKDRVGHHAVYRNDEATAVEDAVFRFPQI